jgi:iron complex transport system substrate-binding protein
MPHKKFISFISSLLLVCLFIAGCGANSTATPTANPTPTTEQFEIVDGLGRMIAFDKPAQKIVSISPSNTEILFAIGAGSQVVGRDEFSDYPEEAKSLPNVGGGFGALDMEKMVLLRPDLVLASQLTPEDQVQSIEKLGLKVFLVDNPETLEDMFTILSQVSQISGTQEQAQALIDQLKTRVSAVDEKIAKVEQKPLVFYELDSTDPNAPWTAGPGSFIEKLITRAGGENLGTKLTDSYAQISIEQLLIDNPEIIILGDYTWGGVTLDDVKARQSWAGIDAVKQDKVFTFDDNLVSRPGPRLVAGLEALAKLLHPELFQ